MSFPLAIGFYLSVFRLLLRKIVYDNINYNQGYDYGPITKYLLQGSSKRWLRHEHFKTRINKYAYFSGRNRPNSTAINTK